MPLLRPSNSDYVAFVKAAASNPAGGGTLSRASVGAEAILGRGAAVRASYAGAKSSPSSSIISFSGPPGPPQFIDVWLNKAGLVSTLAGSPTRATGSADGTGTNATFSFPVGVAVLPNGNMAVADYSNNKIRLITPAGVVTTLAGGGASGTASGSANGTGTNATFSGIYGIAVLPNGNFVVAEQNNNLIRLVTPAGVVTTLAGGNGGTASGSADGTGTNATFSNPRGVAVLPNGNIVVGDYGNHLIRLVTPAGVVTTLAGGGSAGGTAPGSANGTGTNATFFYPQGVAVLPNGTIVVADSQNNLIRLVTPAGVVTTLAGNGGGGLVNGIGTNAQFAAPTGVAVLPNGNIVACDYAIRLITPAGVVTTLAGGVTFASADGVGTNGTFYIPQGLAVLSNGTIVVADSQSNIIRLITPV
jgi:serine/threonine protein kinase, bacterial